MTHQEKYAISTAVEFDPLTLIDVPAVIDSCTEVWQNKTLCQVNDSVVRLGVVKGEFHWHKHDDQDEFFYVVSGLLYVDVKSEDDSWKETELRPGCAYTVPKGIVHRTRAPERTAMMMMAKKEVVPTGDE